MARSILTFICAGATWLTSAAALACGSALPSYYTIAAIEPADGATGFPLDGAVRVELVDTWVYDGGGTYQTNVRITVTRVDTGEAVAGTMSGFGAGYNPMWVPDEPLAANTQYRIDVITADEPRTDIEGPITGSSTFTTGDELSAPIAFDGELRVVALRVGAAQECTNWNDCGGCVPNSDREIPVVYVDVDLPKVSGGFDAYGYGAWVSQLDGDEPVRGGYPRLDSLEAPPWQQFPSEVPSRWTSLLAQVGHPYVPCFELRVLDSLKHELKTSGCFDHEVDLEALLHPDAGSGAASEHDASSDPTDFDAGSESATTVPRTRARADAGTAVPDEHSSSVGSVRERTTVGDEGKSGEADCSATLIGRSRSSWPAAPIALWWLVLDLRRRKRAPRA
jgi:hypothetical protein